MRVVAEQAKSSCFGQVKVRQHAHGTATSAIFGSVETVEKQRSVALITKSSQYVEVVYCSSRAWIP